MAFRLRTGFLTASIIGASILGSVSLTACGGGGDGDGDGDGDGIGEVESSLELFSWWTGGGEAEALDALLDVYNDEYPDVDVINSAATMPETARERLAERMEDNDPPDSFQAISGVDLLTYVADGKMEPLTDLAEELGWTDAIPEAVLKALSGPDGELYGVPVNIERDNNLYYNMQVFTDAEMDPPETLDDFYDACAYFQGEGINPLSVPSAGWVLALVAFENLMPTVNGGKYYTDFFKGTADPSTVEAEMTKLFTEFAKVLECSNVADDKEDWGRWDTHADTMYRGESAMFVMGDWAKGYLETGKDWQGNDVEPFEANVDFGVVPGLGSGEGGYFVFNSAVFGLPRNAQHPNAAKAFLDTVVSAEGQEAFNLKKGSVPANTDTPTDNFDAMVAEAKADFDAAGMGTNQLLPGYASLTTFDYQVLVNPALVVFAIGGERAHAADPTNVPEAESEFEALDIDYIVSKMVSSYGILRQ